MGSLIRKIRQGYATYWEKTGVGDDGSPTYAAPIQLRVRWEEATEEYLDKDGRKQISRARVFVDREMPLGSAIRQSKLADVPNPAAPYANTDTWEVRQYNRLPKRNYSQFLQWIML